MRPLQGHTLGEFKRKIDPDPEVRHLREENALLRSQLSGEKTHRGEFNEIMAEILQAIPQAEPPKLSYQRPPKGKSGPACTAVLHVTDWHIGMTTHADEIEGFGENNYDLAVKRVETLLAAFCKWIDTARAGYNIDEVRVLGTGDYVSGNIHEELLSTNEFPAPVQAVKSGFLLGSLLARLSSQFVTVEADLITMDNHGRIQRKPQMTEGGLNNWGYITANIAKEHVRGVGSIIVNVLPQASAVIDVAGVRYLITHGDGIMGTWGIPYYGIDRRKSREAMARLNMEVGKRFHRIVMGHFHSAMNHEHWQIGGSLTGTDANDHKAGRHSTPHQTAWLVSPSHGEFNWTRFAL